MISELQGGERWEMTVRGKLGGDRMKRRVFDDVRRLMTNQSGHAWHMKIDVFQIRRIESLDSINFTLICSMENFEVQKATFFLIFLQFIPVIQGIALFLVL